MTMTITFGELEVGDLFYDELTEMTFEKMCGNVGEAKREIGKENPLCTFFDTDEVTRVHGY